MARASARAVSISPQTLSSGFSTIALMEAEPTSAIPTAAPSTEEEKASDAARTVAISLIQLVQSFYLGSPLLCLMLPLGDVL